jgi:ketosteroid isomerase-like protein
MSQENVEIARRSYEAFDRGDIDAAFEDFAPDFELDLSRAIGIDRSMYNLAQFRRLTEQFAETWESVRYEADALIDAGEHVVIPFTNRLRGRDGIEVQARGTWLGTIRDGLIVRICLYQELQEALEAAGLRE